MMKFNEARALELLRTGTGKPDATFHDGQLEAIQHIVEGRSRLLVVQRTGWGKSFVYFIATQPLLSGGHSELHEVLSEANRRANVSVRRDRSADPRCGHQSPQIELLRARHGQTADEVMALVQTLERQASTYEAPEFVVSIEYELVLEKKAGPDAVRLVSNAGGTPLQMVKVPRDPKILCPHDSTTCAELLSGITGAKWSKSDVAYVAKYLRIKDDDNQYHYSHSVGKTDFHSYSDGFIDLVCERLKQQPDLKVAARPAPRRRGSK